MCWVLLSIEMTALARTGPALSARTNATAARQNSVRMMREPVMGGLQGTEPDRVRAAIGAESAPLAADVLGIRRSSPRRRKAMRTSDSNTSRRGCHRALIFRDVATGIELDRGPMLHGPRKGVARRECLRPLTTSETVRGGRSRPEVMP